MTTKTYTQDPTTGRFFLTETDADGIKTTREVLCAEPGAIWLPPAGATSAAKVTSTAKTLSEYAAMGKALTAAERAALAKSFSSTITSTMNASMAMKGLGATHGSAFSGLMTSPVVVAPAPALMSPRAKSVKLAYEEYPQFLGVKLKRLRFGMPGEVMGVLRGGKAKWDRWVGADAIDLNEIIHLSDYKRDEFSAHRAYADAVDRWVQKWTDFDHCELAVHLAAKVGKPSSLVDEMRRATDVEKAEFNKALVEKTKEKDRLATEAAQRVERERIEREERQRREAEERELAEIVAFETRVAGGFGTW